MYENIKKLINGDVLLNKGMSRKVFYLDMRLRPTDMKTLGGVLGFEIYGGATLDITDFVKMYLYCEDAYPSELYRIFNRPLRSADLEVRKAVEEGKSFYVIDDGDYFRVELSKDVESYMLSFQISYN